MTDRSLNLEAQKMLLEVDRQLIADPLLWAIYDDHPVRTAPSFDDKSHIFRAKLEGLGYLMLNMFEVVLFELSEKRTRENREGTRVWNQFFHHTVEHSSVVRSILDRPDSAQLFHSTMVSRYRDWKIKMGGTEDRPHHKS